MLELNRVRKICEKCRLIRRRGRIIVPCDGPGRGGTCDISALAYP